MVADLVPDGLWDLIEPLLSPGAERHQMEGSPATRTGNS